MRPRPLSGVPRPALWLFALALLAQLLWAAGRAAAPLRAEALPQAPPQAGLRLAALGEPEALSRLLMLYIQALDEQPGLSLPWRGLDYGRLAGWLGLALDLDPRSQVPLLAASQLYGAVSDEARARLMLDFVYRRFAEDPNRRWPWLAQAALVARHRLHDLPLARRYARALRLQASGPQVPAWARELEAFVLEDMNELDSARLLIGGLISSGQISDPRELAFLAARLRQLEQGAASGAPSH
jgi:hypothetical protein